MKNDRPVLLAKRRPDGVSQLHATHNNPAQALQLTAVSLEARPWQMQYAKHAHSAWSMHGALVHGYCLHARWHRHDSHHELPYAYHVHNGKDAQWPFSLFSPLCPQQSQGSPCMEGCWGAKKGCMARLCSNGMNWSGLNRLSLCHCTLVSDSFHNASVVDGQWLNTVINVSCHSY